MVAVTCRVPHCGATIDDTNPGIAHAVGSQPAPHHVTCQRCGAVHRLTGTDVTIDVEETYEALRAARAAYEPYLGRELQSGRAVPFHPMGELVAATARLQLAEQGVATVSRIGR